MSQNTEHENVLSTPPNEEAIIEYVINHFDEQKKDLGKAFRLVGINYTQVKGYIESVCLSEVRQWVADGLKCSYEDVALHLDKDSMRQLLGDEWFKVWE